MNSLYLPDEYVKESLLRCVMNAKYLSVLLEIIDCTHVNGLATLAELYQPVLRGLDT